MPEKHLINKYGLYTEEGKKFAEFAEKVIKEQILNTYIDGFFPPHEMVHIIVQKAMYLSTLQGARQECIDRDGCSSSIKGDDALDDINGNQEP